MRSARCKMFLYLISCAAYCPDPSRTRLGLRAALKDNLVSLTGTATLFTGARPDLVLQEPRAKLSRVFTAAARSLPAAGNELQHRPQ